MLNCQWFYHLPQEALYFSNPKWCFQLRYREIEIHVTTPLPYKKLDRYGVQTTQVKFSKRQSLDTIKTPF